VAEWVFADKELQKFVDKGRKANGDRTLLTQTTTMNFFTDKSVTKTRGRECH
jgi:hypothetical protein